eukprot:7236674-Lingulodinium_polyedra.AAC.1
MQATEAQPVDPDSPHPDWVENWLTAFEHNFYITYKPEFLGWRDLPRVAIVDVEVLPDLVLRPGMVACSGSEWILSLIHISEPTRR